MDGRIAAIALTIIVAVPILLGYAMAFEEEEITGYETTESVNVTDYTLNSTFPVYTASYSPMNNQQIRATVYWTTQAVTETSVISPGFNATASYSSIPITGHGGYSQSMAAISSDLNQGERTITTPSTNGYVGLQPLASTFPATFELDGIYYGDPLTAGQTIEFAASGDGSAWTLYYNGQRSGSEIESYGSVAQPVAIYTRAFQTISPTDLDSNPVTSYYVAFPCTASVKIVHTDSTTEYVYVSNGTQMMRNGSTVTIGNVAYNNVDTVSAATAYGTDTLICSYSIPTGTYADPAYGWKATVSQGVITMPIYWFNNSLNKSVTMMLDVPEGSSSVIAPGASHNLVNDVTISRASNGMVSVNGTNLGNYRYLSVTVTGSSVSVSGISAWPNMRTAPTLINTVSVDLTYPMENFAGIWIGGSQDVSYRVDVAEIYTGTYPITEDYTLDMATIWPNDDYSVRLSTVGFYGDSIVFGGNTYAVTNGAITVSGSSVRLLNAMFSSVYDSDSDTWSNRINGVEISETVDPSTIVFGGQWSMTLTAYKMEEVTKTELRWQAGEFAWNGVDQSFALIGLLTCGGAFIGLGMYGRRSGAKVGTLMLICGGCALVFLALL